MYAFLWPQVVLLDQIIFFQATCGRQNNGHPPKDVHALIPQICKYVILHGKREFTDISKLRTLSGVGYPGLSGRDRTFPGYGQRSDYTPLWLQKKWTKRNNVAAFEDGWKGPWVKYCRQHLEAGEEKEIDSPLEPPEENAPLVTSWI